MVFDSSTTPLYNLLYWWIIGTVAVIIIADITFTKEQYKIEKKYVLILIGIFVTAPWTAEILLRIITSINND